MRTMTLALRAGMLGLVVLSAAPVSAQTYGSTVSYNGGAIFLGKWNGSGSGTFALQPTAGWVVGVQAE